MNSLDNDLISIEKAVIHSIECMHSSAWNQDDVLFSVYDLDHLKRKIEHVRSVFPTYWKHSVAIKSNPLANILKPIALWGFGLEAASFQEVLHAERMKAPFIVWDSPVKTSAEIQALQKLKTNCYINANSLDELLRFFRSEEIDTARLPLGLRVNPQMQTSSMTSMSVAGGRSKFGEPIANKSGIIEGITSIDQKVGLHVHASSQNLVIEESIAAIHCIYSLAEEIGWERLAYIDIGGGFPVNYGFQEIPTLQSFSSALEKACPKLFDGSIPVITEYGRYYHSNASWTVAQIQEVKRFNDAQVIIQHAGADLFLRESYEPGKWKHRFALMTPSGNLRTEDKLTTDVGGPLCFGGDYLAKDIVLPRAEAGDWLFILDTGSNAHGLWSKHCSRPFPKVIGLQNGEFEVIKERESDADAFNFWF